MAAAKRKVQRLFGTDGIRGVANEAPMDVETMTRIGKAVAYHFRKRGHNSRIVLGKDTRLSGYMFETALAAGICSMGADVWLSGPMSTPGIAHLTVSMRADAGIVISASHNAFADNGVKIFAGDGFKLPDALERELERLAADGLASKRPPVGAIGKALRIEDADGRYITYAKSAYPKDLTLEGWRIVVDCAHGAAYNIAPLIFSELGADVVTLGVEPDGRNINEGVGAVYPEAVAAAVKKHRADIGVALDGDGDRCILVDEKAEVVDGDQIMALLAVRMLKNRELKGRTLVATSMSNLGLEKVMKANRGRLVRTRVGDRYVVEEMRRGGYVFGGEQSGHLVFLEHATTGDGIISALKVLEVMRRERKPLSRLKRAMKRYPQTLLSFKVKEKRPLDKLRSVQRVIAAVEKQLGRDGRVVVRYSGTEHKARVMVEGPRQRSVEQMAEGIAASIKEACG